MSARELVLTEGIYSSKKEALKALKGEIGALAAAGPGNAGWRWKSPTELEEMVSVKPKGSFQSLWLPAAEHIKRTITLREYNRQFYAAHPELLREKIKHKRRAEVFAHSCSLWR